MANKMVANIKSLTTETRGLTKEVESLYKSIEKLNAIAGKAFKNVSGAINTSGGSMGLGQGTTRPGVGTDNARFTQPPAPTGMSNAGGTSQISKSKTTFAEEGQEPAEVTADKLKMLGGAAKIAIALPAGAYAATPDLSLTMGRAFGYYQAGLKSPGISRNQLERATFSAMGGGISSVGSDAIVAAGLAGRGYTPGSANYKQAAAQIGGAYKYLGMSNADATQAIAGFQTGPMGANLYQYGISTYNAATGKEKTPGQIAKELMNVMGGGKATTKQVRESYQRGALGANLRTMGFDAAQQEIIYQSMIDISAGRNPDLAKRGNEQGTDKNSNTMLTAQGRLNASQTSLMTKGESSMIKGFENAADTVEAFNRALENVIQPLSQLKGLVGGVGATNIGAGIGVSASLFSSGVSDIVGEIAKLVMKGGGSVGYGAGFGKGGSGGSAPVAAGVTAAYGEKGDMWSGTNGTHKGTDYAVPIGTPVIAWKDGVVSKEVLDSGYGTAVMIDHPDGMQSIYGHLSSKEVNAGDTIKAGQRVGKSGDTGNSSGPHLHFELRKGKNNPVDPSGYTNAKSLLGGQYVSGFVSPTSSELLGTGAASNSIGATMSIDGPVAKGALSNSELISVLSNAGFSGNSLETAFRVARAESGGRPGALNPNAKTGDYSLGLFQVNMIGNLGKARNAKYLEQYSGIGYKGPESLYDPAINARIAYDISKGGTKWTDAWVNTSKKLGITGGGDMGYGASMPTQLQPGNKTVNVTIAS